MEKSGECYPLSFLDIIQYSHWEEQPSLEFGEYSSETWAIKWRQMPTADELLCSASWYKTCPEGTNMVMKVNNNKNSIVHMIKWTNAKSWTAFYYLYNWHWGCGGQQRNAFERPQWVTFGRKETSCFFRDKNAHTVQSEEKYTLFQFSGFTHLDVMKKYNFLLTWKLDTLNVFLFQPLS